MTTTLSKLTGKPEAYIMIFIHAGQTGMMFGGSTDKCANCWFRSIGKISERENAEYATAIFKALGSIGVSQDRAYIHFEDLKRENVAWNGKLFSQ